MITLKLSGYLKELIGDSIGIEAPNMFEAISSLSLDPRLLGQGEFHQIIIEGFTTKDSLDLAIEGDITVEIQPLFAGAGGSNTMRVVIGVILVVVAVYFGTTGGLDGLLGSGLAATATNMMFTMGMNLIIGGLLGGMQQKPSVNVKNSRSERNNLSSADRNTVSIGSRIPVMYGKVKWYGQMISVDVDSYNYNPDVKDQDGKPSLNFKYYSQIEPTYDGQIPILKHP